MLPIDPNEIHDEQALRDRITDARFTKEYRAKCQSRLEHIIASKASSAQRIEDARRHAKENAVGYKKKPKGKLDKRSAKHSTINGVGAGGAVGGVMFAQQALSVYDDLKSRGIAPDEQVIIQAIDGVMDFGLVIVIVTLLVGGLTLVVKFLKEY